MFQFTTTNVINSNQDYTTGLPLWTSQEATGGKAANFYVKRVNKFVATNVTAIYKAVAEDAEFAKATIDLSQVNGTKGENFRLHIYIGLSQASQSSLYANDLQWKGKPLGVDFVWGDSAADTVTALVKTIKKYEVMVYGKKMLNVTSSGTFLTIEATDEYQRFRILNIEKLDSTKYHGMGEYEVVRSLADLTEADSNAEVTQAAEGYFVGKEGFGTYAFLLHNLRLPTYARNRFMALNQDETPIIGAKYNQYTIYYRKNRGILGNNAVGDVVTSVTTHVFYVKQDLATDFEAGLAKIGTIIVVKPGTETASPDTAITELEQEITQLKAQMANKADKTELEAKADATDLADYATTEALTSGLASKANTSHTHAITDVTDLQTTLANKADKSELTTKADTSALEAKQDKLTAGNGIDLTGNTASVKLDGDTLTASANGLKVTDGKFTEA